MPEISLAVDVAAPPEQVWAAFTDWDRQHEWMLGTVVRSEGDRLTATTTLGPIRFVDTMVVTAREPPWRCVVAHTGRVVRGNGAFEVRPLPEGHAQFVWSEWLELPFGQLGQLGFLLVRPIAITGLKYSLRRFATWTTAR